jgi:3-carboxy-cis,cis-muconate cycloisomerase
MDSMTQPADSTQPVPTTEPALSVPEPTPVRRGIDSGLLSPVRAGTCVEEAVCDEAWLAAMLEAECALARTQARLGLVPPGHAATITRIARTEPFDPVRIAIRAREQANPVVALVDELTAAVARIDPDAATYVHRGSTSQDVFDTGLMLVTVEARRLILADIDRITRALSVIAADHRDTPMPGRTLSQHAVPITFGLKAAGWLVAVGQVRQRLADLPLYAQIGGAAGTLAGYVEYARLAGIDIHAYATDLIRAYADEVGLVEPVLPWHTARLPIADIATTLALVTGVLGKIAADVLVLARTEIGEVAEPTAAGRGASSAMPHKRNPVLATLIRSAATQVPAYAMAVLAAMPAEDERAGGLWQAEWQPLRECLRLTGGAAVAAAELVEGLTVRPERMAANLATVGELVASERVSAVLTPLLGKAEARALVTSLCRRSIDEGRSLAGLLIDADVLPAGEVTALLDPLRYTGVSDLLVERALVFAEQAASDQIAQAG